MEKAMKLPSVVDVHKNRNEVIKRIDGKVETTKFRLVKDSLTIGEISIPDEINDLEELKQYSQTLDKESKEKILSTINTVTDEISNLIVDLKDGSKNAFNRFIDESVKLMNPFNKRARKIGKYNDALDEAEKTYDKDGKLIDTRFEENIQDAVREYFEKSGIKLKSDGYLELRGKIKELSIEQKKELLNIINYMQEKPLMEENEKLSLKERFNNSLFGSILNGAQAGINKVSTINTISPGIVSGAANGTALGFWMEKITDSSLIGWLTGIIGGGGTIALAGMSTVASTIFATESLVIGAIVGGAVGGTAHIGKKTYKASKEVLDKMNKLKLKKEAMELDNKLYKEDNEEEISNNPVLRHQKSNESAVIKLVTDYILESGVVFPINITSMYELESAINKLNKTEKSKILKSLGYMEKVNSDNKNAFDKMAETVKEINDAVQKIASKSKRNDRKNRENGMER